MEWRYTEEGEKVRVSARTGRIIPLSKVAEDLSYDMVKISSYVGEWPTGVLLTLKILTICSDIANY